MNKYDLNRSKFLIILYVFLTISLSVIAIRYQNIGIININVNDYLTKEAIAYEIEIIDQENKDEFISALYNTNTTIFEKNNFKYYYFNKNALYKPIIEEYSNPPLFDNHVIIGTTLYEEYQDNLNKENNFYYSVAGGSSLDTSVVGIIKSTVLDEKGYKSYLLFSPETMEDLNGKYIIDGNISTIKNLENKGVITLSESTYLRVQLSGDSIDNIVYIISLLFILLIVVLILFMTRLWFYRYEREVGIRILCGAYKKSLGTSLIKKYLYINILGLLIGSMFFVLYSIIESKDITNSITLLLIIISLILVTGLIVSGVIYGIITKKTISDILKD